MPSTTPSELLSDLDAKSFPNAFAARAMRAAHAR
jgi:hypothetical protein